MIRGLVAGKSAAITGAAQGIGLEIARLLHEQGAKVMILDVNQGQAAAAAEVLGEGALGRACDVTDGSSVRRAVDATVAEFGDLDIFVNNAGIARDSSLGKMTLADFEASSMCISREVGWVCRPHRQ